MSLGSDVLEALTICDAMRAEGVSTDQMFRSLETLLRDRWPLVREWKYLCETCRDIGLELLSCPARPCERRQGHGPHEYVRPCFCAKSEPWRGKPKTEQTAVEAAARVPKARGFTRLGR